MFSWGDAGLRIYKPLVACGASHTGTIPRFELFLGGPSLSSPNSPTTESQAHQRKMSQDTRYRSAVRSTVSAVRSTNTQ